LIAARYGIREKDAKAWLTATEWEASNEIHPEIIQEVQETLKNLGIIHKKRSYVEFCLSL